ncbi:MAG: MBL fold metallo-hydrolase [Candidatus Tectomicrobia bacterium]|nr:MBL fold metallo-hydrolase [Candidatus Tectomicrobia bacterium]
MQVAANVHLIPVPDPGRPPLYASNGYLVGRGGEVVVIDPGHETEQATQMLLDYVKSIGNPRIRDILLTHAHADHYGGVPRLKEVTGAKLKAHPKAVESLRGTKPLIQVDETIDEGSLIEISGLKIQVVSAPGHSWSQVNYLLLDGMVLFSGDNVLGAGTAAVGGADGDMVTYLETLKKLKSLNSRVICPGHGAMIEDPGKKLDEYLTHRAEREQQILSLLRRGRRTSRDLMMGIYPELQEWLLDSAERQVISHLTKLEGEGRVTAVEEGEKKYYSLK